MSPSTNTRSRSNDKITISNEVTTILSLPSYFSTKYTLDNKIQAMFDHSKKQFYKKHEELVNLNSETFRLSEDTKFLKGKTKTFSSKLIEK